MTWSGGWLCICGRICWPKQHCKACGEPSPCRCWCFEAGCNRADCRFTHPTFYLPKDTPAVGPDGLRLDGNPDLLKLPPPNAVPAVVLAQRRAAAEQAAVARQQQTQRHTYEQQHQHQQEQGSVQMASNQQHRARVPQQRDEWEGGAYNAAADTSGDASGGVWAGLAAQAQASMAGANSGSAGTAGAPAHVQGRIAAVQCVPAAPAPPSLNELPGWDVCHPQPQHPPKVLDEDAAELEAYLCMLGIGNDQPALSHRA